MHYCFRLQDIMLQGAFEATNDLYRTCIPILTLYVHIEQTGMCSENSGTYIELVFYVTCR